MGNVLVVGGGRRDRRRILTVVLVALALAALLATLGPAARANAVDFGSSPITGATLTPAVIADSGTARVDFTWVAPPSAVPGDTFSITLPDQLEPAGTRNIALVDSVTGEVAVLGVWAGKTVTFTFQPYLATHTGVSGSGFFYVMWDQDVVSDSEEVFDDMAIGDFVLGPITHQAPLVTPPPTSQPVSKLSFWNDSGQTGFRFHLRFPGDATADLAGPVTVDDTIDAAAGFTFNCATTDLRLNTLNAPVNPQGDVFYAPAAAPNVTSYSCTPTSITMSISVIPAGWFYTLIVRTIDNDPERDVYTNTAEFEWAAIVGQPFISSSELRRDDAGGVVTADATVCVGDYVWIDANKNGVQDQGESGIPSVVLALQRVNASGIASPVLVDGVPATATTDASGLYRFCGLPVLATGESYRVTIDNAQPALARYTPTFSGRAAVALDSSAIERLADTTADLTVGGASDLTLDFGYFLTEPPGELAQSGATAATGGTAWAGMLVLAYGSVLYLRARRRA